MMKFPRVEVNYNKLVHNVRVIKEKCTTHDINMMGVTKVFCAIPDIAKAYVDGGVDYLADSRVENLKKMKDLEVPKVLLRLPMLSEAKDVVSYADISMNSELETIKALDAAAKEAGKKHKIIVMTDLGDLREGVWPSDLMAFIEEVLKLDSIVVEGLGVNLTCYGGVVPDATNLGRLCDLAGEIEARYELKLNIVSGGNSSSLYLLDRNQMPDGVNNLRPGEALVLGRETAFGDPIENTHQDAFMLKAQIIELKEKQSVPIGTIGMDAFGNTPSFTDRGMRKRAILGIGKQDVDPGNLEPNDDKMIILGASSDHLIVDVTDSASTLKVGDVVEFKLDYGSLLQLSTSEYVAKAVVK